MLTLSAGCQSARVQTEAPRIYERGSVRFSQATLPGCEATNGLTQKEVRRVYSDAELIGHYGLSFWIRFRDPVSPPLYGALYYQNAATNIYCMALPNGYFAAFADRPRERRSNIIQEVCHPIQHCPLLPESKRQTLRQPVPQKGSGTLP